jgi:hypothetical protein
MAKKYILPENSIILAVGKSAEIADKLKKFSPSGKIEYYDIEANPYDPEKNNSPLLEGVTAQTVLKNYIEAVGGETNINKIKDFTMKGTLKIQGKILTMNRSYKFPGKFLSEIMMNGQVIQKQVLNGEKGKSSGMQGNKEITGEELEALKLDAELFPEVNYEKLGYKTELKGVEKVNGKNSYILNKISPSNVVSTDYFDVETGLLIRSRSAMDSQTTDILEYATINNIQFPKKMKTISGPQTIEIFVDSMEVNTSVKDEIFN